ncbi:MAG: carbohydrate-binding protein [Elusimicrobia bacterium]|nr:carbohydrate-binding protein [Elusimicrobiota bacterium]
MGKIIRWCMMFAVVMLGLSTVSQAATGYADFTPGDIYKDFTAKPNTYGKLGILGQILTYGCDTNPVQANLCNNNKPPTDLYVTIGTGDLQDAIKAEVYVTMWGGHYGTTEERIRVNSASDLDWKPLPLPVSTPTQTISAARSIYYLRTLYSTVPIEISPSSLHVGTDNKIQFWATQQPAWGYPHYWVYSFTVRVYYDGSKKLHPTGTISVVQNGDTQTFTANVDTYSAGISSVNYIGWYKDFNWEGDGRFQNWHYICRNGILDKHIGTSITGPSYSVPWNTAWIPDQDEPIKVVARIVGKDGMCFITNTVNPTFSSRNYSVKLYSAKNVPESFSSSGNVIKTCDINISDSMTNIKEAKLIVPTWGGAGESGHTTSREVGINNTMLSNTFGNQVNYNTSPAPDYTFDTMDITPLSVLKGGIGDTGKNTFYIKSLYTDTPTQHHAAEVNWPGPVILVKYNTQGIPTASITSPTNNATYSAPATITINATATDSDGTISKVEFFYNGTYKIGEDTVFPYTYTWLNVQAGSYVLTVKATDNSGNVTTSNPISITVGGGKPVGGWWSEDFNYRFGVDVQAGAYERTNKPVEIAINFTELLTGLSASGTFDPGSIRVVEVLGDGTAKNTVPFQFDQSSTYNATTNAAGTLVFIMDNMTTANATRYYHIYFNTGPETVYTVTPQITLTDNVQDEGKDCFKIVTGRGTYYYSKKGAAFSSMNDIAGNDWIDYQTTQPQKFRGIPNIRPFHPDETISASSIVSQGPLKVKIKSDSNDGLWGCTWDIYPEYAKMTMTKYPNAYSFLYEGNIGGTFDTAGTADYLYMSDGIKHFSGEYEDYESKSLFNSDIPNPEWIYFADGTLNRSLFLVNHQDDTNKDIYYKSNPALSYGNLTVFGFGRTNSPVTGYLNPALPAYYTIGFAESKDLTTTSKTIESSWRDLNVIPRDAEKKPASLSEPITVHTTNPHYFLYKDKPTILIGSNEHYGAVLNLDFSTATYLNTLQADGLNYVRIFSGPYIEPAQNIATDNFHYWNIDNNTLGPTNNGFICPWARSTNPADTGFANDSNSRKFDLSKWDENYFSRLKDFVKGASDRNIIVEITFFCPFWMTSNVKSVPPNIMWFRSPMNVNNNINGVGNIASYTSDGQNSVWDVSSNAAHDDISGDGLRNGGLTPYMGKMVAEVVRRLNEYNNVIYQPSIEPTINYSLTNKGTMSTIFDSYIISTITVTEAALPKKHLISQNHTLDKSTILSNVTVLTWDSDDPNIPGTYSDQNKPMIMDEGTYKGWPDAAYRPGAWRWMLAGGAVFNMLDITFTPNDESGTNVPPLPPLTSRSAFFTKPNDSFTIGGGGPAFRTQMKVLNDFMNKFGFVNMEPNNSVVTSLPSGVGVRALVQTGQQYAIYLSKTLSIPLPAPVGYTLPANQKISASSTFNVNLPAGSYKAEWVDTLTGNPSNTDETFTHPGGNKLMTTPPVACEDIALRILNTAISQPPTVNINTIDVINGSNPPAALTIKVDASSSNGIKQVDFYNGASWLGTDTSSPYEFAWNNVAAGSYSITAKATDNNNTTAMSAPKMVTITDASVSPQQSYGNTPAGTPWLISSTLLSETIIQSENYDMLTTGIGEGEAYHDTTHGQADTKNTLRTTEDVDLQTCTDTDGGYLIGYTKPGEWLEYSINVNQGGDYKIILRGASGLTSNGGPVHLEFGQHNVAPYIKTTSVSVPPTGGWGTWTDVTLSPSVTLTAGNQIMKLVLETSAATGCGNFNYIKLIRISAETPNTVATPTISPSAGTYAGSVIVTLDCATSGAPIRYTTDGTDPTLSSTLYSAPFTLTASATVRARAFKDTMTDSSVNSVAYVITNISTQQSYGNNGNPWQIITGITTIELENYDMVTTGSASGETYNDTTPGNTPNKYRTTEAVDIANCTDAGSGYDVEYTAPTEWLEYSVNVNESADYKIILRGANGTSSANPIHLEFGDHNTVPYRTTPSVSVPATGGWQTWTDVTVADSVTLTQGNQIMKLVMETGSAAGNGNLNYVKLIRLTPDTTPPVVSAVIPTNITGSGTVITWTTNEPANSQVQYGTILPYSNTTTLSDTSGVYTHSVTLSGLTENTVYHYRMVSVDMNGNTTTTGDYSFTTISNDPNPPVISDVRAGVKLNNAVLTWTTDENSDSQVAYGTTTALGTLTTLDTNMNRLHSVPINGLLKNKTYYYKVYSRDTSSNLAESAQYSFKTYNIKHRIYTYYYDDGTTTTKVGASASSSLKFKLQVYNVDENSLATDYTGTVTLTTKNNKSSVLDTTDSTLIGADAGEKEVSIPFRSDINTVELTGDVTAPIVVNFNDMYISKLVGYQGGLIRGTNGLKILIPTGVLSANKYLASIKTSAAPVVKNTMKYVNTVNPICYDFGELTYGAENAPILQNQTFTRAVNITIPYTASDIGTLNEDGLRIYYWTGTDWDLASGVQTVDKTNRTVTATVKHFSTYRILGSYVSADLSNIKIYPNPYNPDTAIQGKLKIINLPMNSIMRLYSVAGRLARELKEIDFGNLGWLEWDGKNDDGDKVGRGIYIYQVEDAAGNKKTGKIGLIK